MLKACQKSAKIDLPLVMSSDAAPGSDSGVIGAVKAPVEESGRVRREGEDGEGESAFALAPRGKGSAGTTRREISEGAISSRTTPEQYSESIDSGAPQAEGESSDRRRERRRGGRSGGGAERRRDEEKSRG